MIFCFRVFLKNIAPRWGYKPCVVVAITNIKHLWCCQEIAPEVLNIGNRHYYSKFIVPTGRDIFLKKTLKLNIITSKFGKFALIFVSFVLTYSSCQNKKQKSC
jgi:hypothetical protein